MYMYTVSIYVTMISPEVKNGLESMHLILFVHQHDVRVLPNCRRLGHNHLQQRHTTVDDWVVAIYMWQAALYVAKS